MASSVLIKDLLRTIQKSWTRFLSIVVIIFLGVLFFVGLNTTGPSMLSSSVDFMEEYEFPSGRIVSSTGINDKDVSMLEKEGFKLLPVKSKDVVDTETGKSLRLYDGGNGVNNLFKLVDGRLPQNAKEIALDHQFAIIQGNLRIGDRIKFDGVDEVTIVGLLDSPLYLSKINRGVLLDGSGDLGGYGLVSDTLIQNYYSELFYYGQTSKPFSTNYRNEVDELKDTVKKTIEKHKVFVNAHYSVSSSSEFSGYSLLENNANKIMRLSIVFSSLFFTFALLIAYVTISRMVLEERINMGIMKQLGYSRLQIMKKFILYSVFSGGLGSLLGVVVGIKLLPNILMKAYSTLHNFDRVKLNVSWPEIIIVVLFAVLIVILPATLLSWKLLKKPPLDLLKEVSPVSSITLIGWKKIGFRGNWVLRNIMRSPGRSLLIVVSMACSVMLIVTGFGIGNSLEGTVNRQFDKIIHYSAIVPVESGVNIENQLSQVKGVNRFYPIHLEQGYTIDKDGNNQQVNVIVPLGSSEEFAEFVSLIDKDGKSYNLSSDDCVGTPTLLRDYSSDDSIQLSIRDKAFHFNIKNESENYVGHYVYQGQGSYQKVFDNLPYTNAYLISYDLKESTIAENDIVSIDGVRSIVNLEKMKQTAVESMKSLRLVTVVLVAAAGCLVFVILYNLMNILLSERMREIATLKVLGLFDWDVSGLFLIELLLLGFVGIISGCFLGNWLVHYIIDILSRADLSFLAVINNTSYVFSVALIFFFISFIMFFVYRRIVKIDKVEAMK